MSQELTGKTAVVTGGSRGIGRAIALALAAKGAAVAVGYRHRGDAAGEVVAEIEAAGGRAVAAGGDLAEERTVLDLFDLAADRFGSIDIVVANAATAGRQALADLTEDDIDRDFLNQLKGLLFTLRESSRRVTDGGRVIAISSINTLIPQPAMGLYSGLKGALEQFVLVLSRELGPRGVTVNAVLPGATDTEALFNDARDIAPGLTALGRLGTPDDIADVVTFLAGPGGRWITGQRITADGGLS